MQHFNLGPAAPLASPLAPKFKVIDTKYYYKQMFMLHSTIN